MPAARALLVAALGLGVLGVADAAGWTGQDGAATAVVAGSAVDDASAAPVTTVDPAETTTTVPAVRQPLVYIAGDSSAGGLGASMQPALTEAGVASKLDFKNSTGLTRDDFYNWPARLREQVPALLPDVVVLMFGGNDAQPIALPDGRKVGVDAPEWAQEYGRRVGETMDFLAADGRKVIWIGVPNAASPDFNARLTILRDALLAQAQARPQITFVDPWTMFDSPSGGYADFVVDEDGEAKEMRADDGYHLNPAGAKRLARVVEREVLAAAAALERPGYAISVPPPTTPATEAFYLVRSGDAWGLVATRLGIPLDQLLAANGATAETPLYVDQKLVVPTG